MGCPPEEPGGPPRYGTNFPGDDLGDEMSAARVALSTNAGLNRRRSALSSALHRAEAGRRWLRGVRRAFVRVRALLRLPKPLLGSGYPRFRVSGDIYFSSMCHIQILAVSGSLPNGLDMRCGCAGGERCSRNGESIRDYLVMFIQPAQARRHGRISTQVAALQVANPPLVGVICGILVGASPLGQLLYRPDSPAVVAQTLRLPIELRVCLGT